MISPEEIFIRDLEAYFAFDIEFNDVIRKKIMYLLSEYRSKINIEIKIVNKNFIVYKSLAGNVVKPNTDKKILSKELIGNEFLNYCNDNGIKFDNIKKQGRSTKAITKIRVDFCNYAAENFLVSKTELANFFGLNHATIHYYFNPNSKKK